MTKLRERELVVMDELLEKGWHACQACRLAVSKFHVENFETPSPAPMLDLSIELWEILVLPQLECKAYNTSVNCLKGFLLE